MGAERSREASFVAPVVVVVVAVTAGGGGGGCGCGCGACGVGDGGGWRIEAAVMIGAVAIGAGEP